MRRALALARRFVGDTHPNPAVGCVLVKEGRLVGEGAHPCAGAPHAEVHALRQAGAAARGATAYVSLEPCNHHGRTPPCTEALIAAGVTRVVYAVEDPNPQVAGRGAARLRAAGLAVECGLLAAEAAALNEGFFHRMRTGRPFVRLKVAASLDGRTAMASGESRWISSEAARAEVHRLRHRAGAVLVGAATVLADDPALTVRHRTVARPPDRIVLDPQARVPASARVWTQDGARRFWLTAEDGPAPPGVVRLSVPRSPDGRLDLAAVLSALGAAGVNEVLVEAGPTLTGALIGAGLVNEFWLYLAPRLLGDHARALAVLPGLNRLAEAPSFRIVSARRIGPDLRIVARP